MSDLSKEMAAALSDYRHEMWQIRKKELDLDQEKEAVFNEFLNRCDAIHREQGYRALWSHKRSKRSIWGDDGILPDDEKI